MGAAGSAVGGPGVWAFQAFRWGMPVAALAVAADALRRPGWHFAAGRAGLRARLGWVLPQIAFGLLMILVFAAPDTPGIDYALLASIPVMPAIEIAYLLRVVFPTGARREARTSRDPRRADREDEGGAHPGVSPEGR